MSKETSCRKKLRIGDNIAVSRDLLATRLSIWGRRKIKAEKTRETCKIQTIILLTSQTKSLRFIKTTSLVLMNLSMLTVLKEWLRESEDTIRWKFLLEIDTWRPSQTGLTTLWLWRPLMLSFLRSHKKKIILKRPSPWTVVNCEYQKMMIKNNWGTQYIITNPGRQVRPLNSFAETVNNYREEISQEKRRKMRFKKIKNTKEVIRDPVSLRLPDKNKKGKWELQIDHRGVLADIMQESQISLLISKRTKATHYN